MKPLAPYFGNRFAAVAKKKATTSRKAKATSEMEALEPRILLSGLTGGAKKSVSFFDADGDKVQVTLQGQGSFNIDLGGARNNADIANITINPDKAGVAGSLGVVVTPVGSFTKPVQTKAIFNPNVGLSTDFNGNLNLGKGDLNQKLQTQYYDLTPGYTNIGSITVATGTTQVGSIGLNAAVVPVIDLGTAAAGNINFSTGMVAKVDNFMQSNNQGYSEANQPLNGLGWTAGLGQINVYDISAGSIAGINLAGDPTGVNNFLGTITAKDGGLGRLTGVNSFFNGNIVLEGANSSLGNVVLGGGFTTASTISAGNNLTFNAAGFSGLIQVGGHLNLGLSGGGNFTGTILAAKGVSGLGSSTTDAILASGNFISGQIITQGDIADITLNSSTFAGTLDAKNIGTIHVGANSFLGNGGAGTILASGNLEGIVVRNADLNVNNLKTLIVGDTIGLLDVAGGNIVGSILAKNIDAVSVRGGDIGANATLFASGKIGTVTVLDGTLAGTIIAQGADGIGAINVTAVDNVGSVNAIDGATIYSAGGIASINATSVNGDAIGNNSRIQAVGTIGPITATSYNGTAINGLDLLAPTLSGITATSAFGNAIAGNNNFIATTGSVSNITASGYTGGIIGNTVITAKTSVGAIKAFAIQSGDAINGLTINAGTTVSAIEGTASGVAGGDGIANLTINATGLVENITGTSFAGDGIFNGNITSTTGNISNITGSSTAIGGLNGISGLTVNALTGSVGDITGSSVSGAGLLDLDVEALTGIGKVSGSSIFGDGIADNLGNQYRVTGPGANIGAILATTVNGIAINGANFLSVGGTITSITATPSGVGGSAIGGGASFTAQTLGDITVNVTNLQGGFAIDGATFESTIGDIGNVQVTNSSLATNAYGIRNATFQSAEDIGTIQVTTNGIDSDAVSLSSFTANDNIGAITITTNGESSDGVYNSQFTANADCLGADGSFGDVLITVNGKDSNGIQQDAGSLFTNTFVADDAANIGAVEIQVTHCEGGVGILGNVGKPVIFNIDGNMASLTVENAGEALADNGIQDAKLTIVGTLGPVSITTVGGSGMVNASIDPTTIESVSISSPDTADLGAVAIDGTSEIIATVSIGTVTITGDVAGTIKTDSATTTASTIGATKITGDFSGTIEAGTTIGAIEITGNATGAITSGTEAAGNVTSIKAGTVGVGISTLTVTAGTLLNEGTIGTIEITGSDVAGQDIALNAFKVTAGGTIGTIKAEALSDTEVLTVNVGANAIELGAVTVAAPGGTPANTADLFLIGGGASLAKLGAVNVDGDANISGLTLATNATIGAISVGGNLIVGTALSTAKTITSFNVGTLAAPGGVAIYIGNAGAVAADGSSIGQITIGTDVGGPGVYQFTFDSYTGAPNNAVITGPPVQNLTAVGAGGAPSTAGGLNFTLV